MAEPTQFKFELSEVAEVLARKQGLDKGRWLLGFEFNMVAGNIGLPDAGVRPAAVLSVMRISLAELPGDLPAPEGLPVVDAGKLREPVPTSAPTARRKPRK